MSKPYRNSIVILGLVSLALGLLGAWAVSRVAVRMRLLDAPNRRSSHTVPTPRGGGLGIVAAFLLPVVYLRILPAIWSPLTALSLVGFLGDRMDGINRLAAITGLVGFGLSGFSIFQAHTPLCR